MRKPILTLAVLLIVGMLAGAVYTVTAGHRFNKDLDDVREVALRGILRNGENAVCVQIETTPDDSFLKQLIARIRRTPPSKSAHDADPKFLTRFKDLRLTFVPVSRVRMTGYVRIDVSTKNPVSIYRIYVPKRISQDRYSVEVDMLGRVWDDSFGKSYDIVRLNGKWEILAVSQIWVTSIQRLQAGGTA